MRTFETPGPLRLRIEVAAGEIWIETVDGAQTEVELEGLNAAGIEAVASARVELRGEELRIEIPDRPFFDFGSSPEVGVRVRAPHGVDVKTRAASADVAGRGRFGSIDVKSASGDVEFDEVGATAKVETASGDVELGRLIVGGEVSLVSGDVLVRELRGSLDAGTVSGDIRIEAVSEGSLALHSVSGDVRVGVCRGSRLWVDASAVSGDTSSGLELSDEPPEEDGPLVELRGQTVSGDFRVERAEALPEPGRA